MDSTKHASINSGKRRQGVFWICTIPFAQWHVPESLPDQLSWLRGQQEIGESGYHHWQLVCGFNQKCSLKQVKQFFGEQCHAELTKSGAAAEYCWKEATRVSGTQFELGAKTINPSVKTDWEHVWTAAKSGDLSEIPANIRVVSYR